MNGEPVSVSLSPSTLKKMTGGLNVIIGTFAGRSLTTGSANFFLGHNAGADVTEESNLVIIGDDIRSIPTDGFSGVLVLASRVALGPLLFGEPSQVYETICGLLASASRAHMNVEPLQQGTPCA